MANLNDKMICRACLCEIKKTLNSLLDNPNLLALYTSCTHLKVNHIDPLPKNLCLACVNKCFSWNSFREMCVVNESILLNEVDELKFEDNPTGMSQQPTPISEDISIVEDQVIMHLNNSSEFVDTKSLKVEFDEIIIKHENLLSDELLIGLPDEIPINSQENDEIDAWNWDPKTEIIYSDNKNTNDVVELNKIDNHQQETKLMECDECGEKFKTKTLIKNHMKKHVTFECSHCGRAFLTRSNLVQHEKSKKCVLKCSVCDERFKSIRQLKSHRILHSELRPHKCTICDYSTTTLFFLNAHQRIHTGENPFQCDKCDKTFTTSNNLKTHCRIHLEQSSMCAMCGKTFSTKSKLKYHMIDHQDEKPVKCNICDKGFKSNFQLKEHVTIHTGEKPFACTLCEKSFRQQQQLKYHLLSHTGERPFKCTECEKSFKTSSRLKIHMRLHTGERPFTCQICYRSFHNTVNFKQHSKTHSVIKQLKCELCDKSFHRNAHLVLHMRKHTGEKPFRCSVCEKEYSKNWQLRMHMECHTDEKPFNCTICGKSFGIEDNFKLHLKDHEPPSCSICKDVFNSKNMLARHMNAIHGESISNSDYYREYAKRQLECPVCKKQIKLVYKAAHMKTHMERSYKCELCPWTFTKAQGLSRHMISHSNDHPYKCEYCEKSFKRICHRTEHTRLHTGQAPTCKLCNKMYAQRADLVIHMRSHTGEKPYECTVCDAAFDSQTKLKKHSQKHKSEEQNI